MKKTEQLIGQHGITFDNMVSILRLLSVTDVLLLRILSALPLPPHTSPLEIQDLKLFLKVVGAGAYINFVKLFYLEMLQVTN